MDIALTPAEIAALNSIAQDKETVTDVVRRLLAPALKTAGEAQLQELAAHFRTLSPTDKLYLANAAKLLPSVP